MKREENLRNPIGVEMNYRAFELAAVEARAGINEIDAEIDRLKARRELLEVLESVARQVLTVVPMSLDAIPAGSVPGAAAREQPSFEDHLPEGWPDSLRKTEWPAGSPAGTTRDTRGTEQPSIADLISPEKSHTLRNDGWPAESPEDPRRIRELL